MNDNMEKAILINNLNQIKTIKKFDRIYIGDEFCFKKIFKLDDLKKNASTINFRKITFLTPFVDNSELFKLKEIFDFLQTQYNEMEIVFNDWGVFNILKKYKFQKILGRLLNKQKKDPRINYLFKLVNEGTKKTFKSSILNNKFFKEFMINNDIKRIELDNVIQGFKNVKFSHASIYFPRVVTTVSRKCIDSEFNYIYKHKCNKECLRNKIELEKRQMSKKLYIEGNHQYYINKKLPSNLSERGIDRIVYNEPVKLRK